MVPVAATPLENSSVGSHLVRVRSPVGWLTLFGKQARDAIGARARPPMATNVPFGLLGLDTAGSDDGRPAAALIPEDGFEGCR
jgi:hypothetical protein